MGKSTVLTQKMTEALIAADLERGELDNLPLTVGVGLLRRKLIEDDWTTGQAQSSTIGFPRYNGVKLTAKGIEAAATYERLGQQRAKNTFQEVSYGCAPYHRNR